MKKMIKIILLALFLILNSVNTEEVQKNETHIENPLIHNETAKTDHEDHEKMEDSDEKNTEENNNADGEYDEINSNYTAHQEEGNIIFYFRADIYFRFRMGGENERLRTRLCLYDPFRIQKKRNLL